MGKGVAEREASSVAMADSGGGRRAGEGERRGRAGAWLGCGPAGVARLFFFKKNKFRGK